ncbi:L,D-transpeptidase family protein [Ottowia sp.]|uniref:L,D-transpeptidase family protein n=1 Tax=Ottowia sp. TaxID=1898956 RepID=UPI002C3972AB|nr:L,D-transpeptidase family protein [Ottowia sp.]HNR83099.1 L,D-transpeptidase family protein [Ottowia sp.]
MLTRARLGAAAALLWLAPWAQAQPLWLDALGQPGPAAREAIGWLTQAERDGLQPHDYDAARWARSLDPGQRLAATEAGAWDATLTQTLTRYLHELRHGRVPAAALGARYDSVGQPAPDLAERLHDAVRNGRPAEALAAATPPWPQYPLLRTALAQYRALVDDPAWRTALPPLSGDRLRPGQRWPGLAALAARLHALGDLDAAPATEPDTFDPALQDAVKAFQERHGLSADGVLGKATLEALDVPPAARARQIALALERLRLTPLPAAERFVTVNVPEFMLYAWQRQDQAVHQAFAMRVIVGKAVGTRTPLFDEDMRRIEFNPYWNIPPSIARGETLPKLRANPGYLAAQGMEFVGPGGQTSSAVTTELLDAVQAGQWRLRQRPGRLNALGDIKFVLPNDQNIYLHHTPSVGLFQRARRDFSHGCIRIEQPVALAQWVLADDPDWSEARIRQTMGQPRTVSVALPTPVPVLIVYRTVSVRDGRVHFAPDLYRQDALLERALAQRPHPARGPGPVRGAS